jgi:hypothetical protein
MKKRLLLTILLCAAVVTVEAQTEKKAQAGFRFLENPVAAEAMGRGGTGIVATQNANGLFWNPALAGWVVPAVDLALNRTQGIADINYNALAATLHLWDAGVIGLTFFSMDYGDFYGTRRADNDQGFEDTGVFSPSAFAVGISFSQKVSDRFSYGVQVKYAFQDLGSAWVAPQGTSFGDPSFTMSERGYSHGDFALDVGAYYDFLYNGIRFGAVLQNISREIKYENEQFPMPFAVSFGLTVEPLQFFMDGEGAADLLLCAESRHPRDFDENLRLGAQYTIFGLVALRAGYQAKFDERGLTAGLGVRYDMSGIPVRADYAYEHFGIFGAVHHFTLGVSY